VFSTGMVVYADVCMSCGRLGPLSTDPEALAKALE
jgi:hypothetical protein